MVVLACKNGSINESGIALNSPGLLLMDGALAYGRGSCSWIGLLLMDGALAHGWGS